MTRLIFNLAHCSPLARLSREQVIESPSNHLGMNATRGCPGRRTARRVGARSRYANSLEGLAKFGCMGALVGVNLLLGRLTTAAEAPRDKSGAAAPPSSVDWGLLDFDTVRREPRITKVVVCLRRVEKFPFEDWDNNIQEFWHPESKQAKRERKPQILAMEATVEDDIRSVFLEHALSGSMRLAYAAFDDRFWGRMEDVAIVVGDIVIHTSKGKIRVTVTDCGFVLESSKPRWDHRFVSWGLTKVLDDLYFEKTREHLPDEVFQAWSGESQVVGQKELYRTHVQDRLRPTLGAPGSASDQ